MAAAEAAAEAASSSKGKGSGMSLEAEFDLYSDRHKVRVQRAPAARRPLASPLLPALPRAPTHPRSRPPSLPPLPPPVPPVLQGQYALRKLYHESDRVVLVLYTAPTCGPCRTLKPILSKVVDEYAGKVCARARVCVLWGVVVVVVVCVCGIVGVWEGRGARVRGEKAGRAAPPAATARRALTPPHPPLPPPPLVRP